MFRTGVLTFTGAWLGAPKGPKLQGVQTYDDDINFGAKMGAQFPTILTLGVPGPENGAHKGDLFWGLFLGPPKELQ